MKKEERERVRRDQKKIKEKNICISVYMCIYKYVYTVPRAEAKANDGH